MLWIRVLVNITPSGCLTYSLLISRFSRFQELLRVSSGRMKTLALYFLDADVSEEDSLALNRISKNKEGTFLPFKSNSLNCLLPTSRFSAALVTHLLFTTSGPVATEYAWSGSGRGTESPKFVGGVGVWSIMGGLLTFHSLPSRQGGRNVLSPSCRLLCVSECIIIRLPDGCRRLMLRCFAFNREVCCRSRRALCWLLAVVRN